MPIDMFGLVIGKVQAENKGLQPPDSTQIGLISSMMGNPVMSLVISRSLADKKVAELTPPPPPREEPDGEEPDGEKPETDFDRHLQAQVDTLKTAVAQIQETLIDIQQKLPPAPPPPPPEGQGDQKVKSKGGG